MINLIGQKKLFTVLFSVWGHLRPEIEEESKWRSMIWFAPNSFISYRKRVNEICRRKFCRCLKCSSASDGNQRTNDRPDRKWALYWRYKRSNRSISSSRRNDKTALIQLYQLRIVHSCIKTIARIYMKYSTKLLCDGIGRNHVFCCLSF